MHTDWNFLKKILLFVRKWIKWYLMMKPVGEGWWRDCRRPGPAPPWPPAITYWWSRDRGSGKQCFDGTSDQGHLWPAFRQMEEGGTSLGTCQQESDSSVVSVTSLDQQVLQQQSSWPPWYVVFSSQTNSADIIQTVPVSGATHIYQLFSGTRYKILMKYFSSKILFQGALSAWLQSMSSAANTIGGNPARPEYSLDQ